MNPAQWLIRTAALAPQAPALFKGTQLEANYAAFLDRVAALASWLHAQYGVRKGDRVAVFMSNCTEYLEALYAIWFLGAVAVPINAKLHARRPLGSSRMRRRSWLLSATILSAHCKR